MSNELDVAALTAPFEASEIDWRIGRVGKNDRGVWATCLAYVDSRAVTHRLDLACGPHGWKMEQPVPLISENKIAGFLIGISIKVGDEWITKWDGADTTDIEAIKGGLSSAIRRACAMWSIGKYLYNLHEGFATILDGKQPGSKYQPANTAKGTPAFNWMPPQLPAWALPGGTGYPPANSMDARGEESQVPQSRPQGQSSAPPSGGGFKPMRLCPECGKQKVIPSKFGSGDYCLECKAKFPDGVEEGTAATAPPMSDDTPF
jgi:hypothetical protein